ncbi:MAG: DUF1553 domain-containing protein [Phycisphaerae bacterium]|nr:DUF1553 domain-containing protein [Phycisphaerae bacterium]
MSFTGLAIALLAACSADAPAAPPAQLAINPAQINLDHSADRQRIVIVLTSPDGQTRDVTAAAQLGFAADGIAGVENGALAPIADGETLLTASAEGQAAQARVIVRHMEKRRPVSFRNDVLPVLMKAGCNAGSCHGSAQGKNGFRLSLFGFEPDKDYVSLTRDVWSRRVDLADPHRSLMLSKPAGEVAHEGGRRLERGTPMYDLLAEWIAARTPDDPPDLPVLTGIECLPAEAVMRGAGQTQQLVVRATYSDGTDRDVTSLAVFDPTDALTAAVDANGQVTSGLPGEAFVMARFGTFALVTQVIVRAAETSFAWNDEPAANLIDEAIHAKLRKLQILPSDVADDATFLRRIYLDVLGVLPTREEIEAFLADAAADKRARLIDALLNRPEFPELWAMKWAELLRIESASQRISFKAMYRYNQWLRESILANKPLNAMVRELLTSEGGNFSTPAVNFYLVETDPTLIAENVAQVFAGIRIQCAQCHNHPFERWTQDDYYAFAAFFPQIGKKQAEDPRETVVFNSGAGDVRHLRDGRVMAPRVLGGAASSVPAGVDRRVALADWLTAPDNPWFAACFVDRVWAHFMGRGLVEPPDDVRVSNPPSHPELRRELARLFVESNYDLRALVRLICNSRAYQRSSRPNAVNARDVRNFSRAAIRRLSAEVLLDAVCRVTGVPEKYSGLPLGARAVQIADARSGSYFLDVFGRPPRLSACTCERSNEPTLSQALHLINGQTLTAKIASDAGRLAKQLAAGTTPEAIIEDLYLTALTRKPTAAEMAHLVAALSAADNPRQGLEDVYWAVLNSKEFVFNH